MRALREAAKRYGLDKRSARMTKLVATKFPDDDELNILRNALAREGLEWVLGTEYDWYVCGPGDAAYRLDGCTVSSYADAMAFYKKNAGVKRMPSGMCLWCI